MEKKDEYPVKVKASIAMASAVRGAQALRPTNNAAPKPWDGYLFFWNRRPDAAKAAEGKTEPPGDHHRMVGPSEPLQRQDTEISSQNNE